MAGVGTYIYCTRYSELKSVLICAIRCPYALKCQDWAGALTSDRRERIEEEVNAYALAKGVTVDPEVWHPLQKKSRRRVNAREKGARVAELSSSGASRLSSRQRHSQPQEEARMGEVKRGEVKQAAAPSDVKGVESKTPARKKRAAASPRRRKGGTNPSGTIFLILEQNGRYREVKSEEEMKRIAIESAGRNKKGLRFARATLLEVEVTFRPVR
ncbi:MAG: hypothetical protein N0A16_05675 [Blastocatellia bacterium]|nr:hypothetical protein [Blastocatellia bacterium]MCS7157198.1 hypothetical protein [Blastocatellia bacterium]MCX7752339.1 hypothetical protein [Blastocatellia bacterium]MDW8167220.1 hypothetical protein [Acidobacteriota bacterium]